MDQRIKGWEMVSEIKTYNIDGKIRTIETNKHKVPIFHTSEEWCKIKCKDDQRKDCQSMCEFTECMYRWKGFGIPQCTFF